MGAIKKKETLRRVRSDHRTMLPRSSEPKQQAAGIRVTLCSGKTSWKKPCLRKGFRSTEASTQQLEMLQAYARLPLRPTVHERRARGASNALLLQQCNTAGYNVHLRNVSTFSQEEISSATPSTPHPPRSLLLPSPEFERRFRLGFVCFWECLLVPEGGKRRWHKAETVKFRSGKLECWVVSNSSKYRHHCVWSVLTDRAALEQSRPDFPRVVSQIKGFALDSELGVTAVWRSNGDPNGDVVGVEKTDAGSWMWRSFLLLYGTPHANSRQCGRDFQFARSGGNVL